MATSPRCEIADPASIDRYSNLIAAVVNEHGLIVSVGMTVSMKGIGRFWHFTRIIIFHRSSVSLHLRRSDQ